MELLRPEEIARLEGLALRARAVVDGVFSGRHRSLHRGASRDFSEHKEYAPGDDLRTLDWKAYGRFDRPLVKRYESETERGCLLLLDVSRSMSYGTATLAKLEWCRVTAAAVAFVLLAQRDRVGLGLLGPEFTPVLPLRSRGDQLTAVVSALEAAAPRDASPGALSDSLAAAVEAAPRRGLVVVLSDLLEPSPALPAALRRLATGHREVAVWQVLDPTEERFPFDGFRRFTSEELPGTRLDLDAREARHAYLAQLAGLRSRLQKAARASGFDYLSATTDRSPAELILDWIALRESRQGPGSRQDPGTSQGPGARQGHHPASLREATP
jgi:uncharacterized protein (DUF58 family)